MYLNKNITYTSVKNAIKMNIKEFSIPHVPIIHQTSTSQNNDYDFISIHPQGQPCYCWIYNNPETTVELIDKNFNETFIKNFSIEKKLAYGGIHGTIFYGTFVLIDNIKYFIINDILYYKGNFIDPNKTTEFTKLKIIYYILTNYITNMPKNAIQFHSLYYANTYNEFINLFSKKCLPAPTTAKFSHFFYPIAYIQYHKFYNTSKKTYKKLWVNRSLASSASSAYLTTPQYATFWTKADKNPDIYYLYDKYPTPTNEHDNEQSFAIASHTHRYIALIPDYKTSIYMNNLFRNIKANNRLDEIEESDDESDGNNTTDNDSINLTPVYTHDLLKPCIIQLKYKWNNTFKKYYPIIS